MRRAAASSVLFFAAAAALAADGSASPHADLFRELAAETQGDRDEAAQRLVRAEGLRADEVRAALAAAGPRARPLLYQVAAARGMSSLVPEIVAGLTSSEPLVSDAAVRALVTLGDEAVAVGVAKLAESESPEAAAVRKHLTALSLRRTVEREVVSRWRRKGGSYEGRYTAIAKLGWPVQPVLLGMLLDIPVPDHAIVLPPTDDPNVARAAQFMALVDIANSNRRGYRTFDQLPLTIMQDEVFDLAAQALKDVADIDLLGDILESVSSDLEQADATPGFRLRRWEESFYREIDVVLFARGRTRRLQRDAEVLRDEVENARNWADRLGGDGQADLLQRLSVSLSEYAGILHQLRRYDEAAELFAEVLRIGKQLGGKEPANAGYNRACALARAGRKAEAIAQLARCLDRDRSTGFEDLTREWVSEDGDLDSLRDDPRYKTLMRLRFGEVAEKPPAPGGAGGSPGGDRLPPVVPGPRDGK